MKHPEILSLHNISNLRISPGAGRCAFLVHTPCEAENNYETHIHISDFAQSYPLGVSGITSFAWVDEATLAVARPNGDSTQCALLSLKNGLEETVWEIPFSARIEGWVSGRLLISARRPITEEKAGEDGAWTILDEFPLWEDGVGYRAKIRRQLFLCSCDGRLKRISPEGMDVRIVSADLCCLVYAGYTPGILAGAANEIHYWDGEDRVLCKNHGEIKHLALGSNYAFFYAAGIGSEADDAPALMQVSLHTGNAGILYASGIAVGNYIVSDVCLQEKTFCADGDNLYFAATEKGSSQIYKLAAGGEPLPLTLDPGSINQLDVRAGRIAFAGLRRGACPEVYILKDGEQKVSSLHNEDLLPCHPMVEIPCHGIQGWALREETDEKTCPAVLFLHDGPQQAFGEVYHFGMQLLAQNGYVVLFANLPGSMGYGEDFSKLDGHWGDYDYNGLIRFLDAALDACPEIDSSRMAVIGTGYGAYLAATATGKCDRFRAAVCDGVISNCVSMVSTSDYGIEFAEKQMKACAFRQTAKLWTRSPLSRIPSMKTPTLLLHGENDRRSHLSQGQMLFTALKVHDVPARLCVFPGQHHGLAGRGTPLARDRYYSEILRWLRMYL